MTNEEAIKILDKLSKIRSDGYYEYLSNGGKEDTEFNDEMSALDIAIFSIEKRIPKRPKKYIAFDGIERNGCPCCPKNEILYAGQKYCSVCGQAIDCSKYEEKTNNETN